MKTSFILEVEQSLTAPPETLGCFADPRDFEVDNVPSLPFCYSLGDQIRRSREGLDNSFVQDLVDYDKDPNEYDPHADIRSTFDERAAYKAQKDAERKKRHEQTTTESKGVSSSTSTTTAAAPVAPPAAESGK